MRYKAPARERLRVEAAEDFTLIYDRASGQTHILAPPMPQLIDLLADRALDLGAIAGALAAAFALVEEDPEPALSARLEELVALGLVERVA